MAGVWTRNYFNILTAQYLCDDSVSSSSAPTDYDIPIRIRRPEGSYSQVIQSNVMSSAANIGSAEPWLIQPFTKGGTLLTQAKLATSAPSFDSMRPGLIIAIGNGMTPATYEDYRIESIVASGLTLTNPAGARALASNYDNVTHEISSSRSYTITNSTSGNINVSEVGLYIPYQDQYYCLIYRDMFDTMTLGPSESLVLTFNRKGEVINYIPY